MKKNDKRHADTLKSAVSTLRQVQVAPCGTELYGRLDKIMCSIEEIINELQPDDE
jgi:hypothetical protein